MPSWITLGARFFNEVSLAGADMASGSSPICLAGLEAIQSQPRLLIRHSYTEQRAALGYPHAPAYGTPGGFSATVMPETRAQFPRTGRGARSQTRRAGGCFAAAGVGLAVRSTAFWPAFERLSRSWAIWSRMRSDGALAPIDAQIEASNCAAESTRAQSQPHFSSFGGKPADRRASQHRGRSICIRISRGASQRFASLFCASDRRGSRCSGDLGGAGVCPGDRQAPGFAQTETDCAASRPSIAKAASARLPGGNPGAFWLGADYQALLF